MKRKTTILRLGLLLLGILISQSSFTQENYIQGQIINVKGDTLHGFIDYRNWKNPPKKINFIKNPDTEPIVYDPSDIIRFKVQDDTYISSIVETEISSSKTNQLDKEHALNIQIDTTFLQVLFEGDKSLYYYKNAFGQKNFYIKRGGVIELLVHKKYLKDKRNATVIGENKRYLGQLKIYLRDCPNIQSTLSNTIYGQNSLIKLYTHYYKCSNSKAILEAKEEGMSAQIGILAGISISSLDFTSVDDDFTYLTNVDYSSSVNPTAGFFIDVVFPRNWRKWSINNEVLFTSYKFSNRYEHIESANDYSIFTTDIGFSYIKINNLIRYKFSTNNRFITYINGGIATGFNIGETNYTKEEKNFFGIESTIEGKSIGLIKKHELGILFGLGAKLDKISLEIRYERGNGMSNNRYLGSSTNRCFILLGYRF